jgi:hypothetical protein
VNLLNKRILTIVAVIIIIIAAGTVGFMKGRDYQFNKSMGTGVSNEPSTQVATQTTKTTKTTDTQTIAGEFFTAIDGESDGVNFKVTSDSPAIPLNARFTFTNKVESLLGITKAGKLGLPGCDFIAGKAEIVVKNYTDPDEVDDVLNGAELVSVNKIIEPAQCGRGYYNF